MKPLIRLYPRSWRERYGTEMEDLVDELPSDLGVTLDLLIGAARAYAAVVAGNRVLSAAAAYVQGVCAAVLVQAIAFVTLILISQQTAGETRVQAGPFLLATVVRPFFLHGGIRTLPAVVLTQGLAPEWLPGLVLLAALAVALAIVVAAPRLVRALD